MKDILEKCLLVGKMYWKFFGKNLGKCSWSFRIGQAEKPKKAPTPTHSLNENDSCLYSHAGAQVAYVSEYSHRNIS